jgi:anti-sigma B factor antagonist
VITECPILVGIFDGYSWIRCEGKGSFLNSPEMKAFGDERITAGETCLVVDLGGCSGMDSTFMGTLAGMAARISAHDSGVLHIADSGSRNQRSLEDLGLDFLMEIDPPIAVWRGQVDPTRAGLKPFKTTTASPRSEFILEAHRVLADANEGNAREFSNVIHVLESDLASKKLRETKHSENH